MGNGYIKISKPRKKYVRGDLLPVYACRQFIEQHNNNAVLKSGVHILRQRRDVGKQVEAGSRQVEPRY